MTLAETHRDPSSRERKALALSLCALGGVVAFMIWHKPTGLMLISCVSSLAWCASILFNHDEPRGRQWKAVAIPVSVGLMYAAVQYFDSPATIAVAVAVVFVVIGILVWFRERFGNAFYKTWSLLFLPLAWSVSTGLLILVYYGVLTPIGLGLRTVGRDPMHRSFDRDETTYWVKRHEVDDLERYFRQF